MCKLEAQRLKAAEKAGVIRIITGTLHEYGKVFEEEDIAIISTDMFRKFVESTPEDEEGISRLLFSFIDASIADLSKVDDGSNAAFNF